MTAAPGTRITPMVGRLMAVNLGVLVLLMTVLTAPAIRLALVLDPAEPFARPWSILTAPFVHGGPLHLALTLLLLFLFGPSVEERLGARRFLLLYLACALGTAVFAMGLAGLMTLPPVYGSSGAVLGVALIFVLLRPDAELTVLPMPVPLSAATILGIVVVVDILGALRFADDGLAHLAHGGGLITAYAWFRIDTLRQRRLAPPARAPRQPAMATQLQVRREGRVAVAPPAPADRAPAPRVPPVEYERAEMDRVLDKISSSGLASLTPAERRFLQEMADRRKSDTR